MTESEKKPGTRKEWIAIVIVVIIALLMIALGILLVVMNSKKAEAQPEKPTGPHGVPLFIGIGLVMTLLDGRSMAIHESLSERCQNCAKFPGNDLKCEHDALNRRVVHALDYGCGHFIKQGDVSEFALSRDKGTK